MANIKRKCDFCKDKDAKYDSKHKIYGCWGYMCPQCYKKYGYTIKGLFSVINKGIPDE